MKVHSFIEMGEVTLERWLRALDILPGYSFLPGHESQHLHGSSQSQLRNLCARHKVQGHILGKQDNLKLVPSNHVLKTNKNQSAATACLALRRKRQMGLY